MPDKAIDTFYQAIKATSDSKIIGECYNNIGKSYYKKGQHKKALQAFSRGVDEDPTNEEIRMNRKVAMQAYEEQMAR
jgi:tetratricopeptide (TPR) repeat protein